MDSKKMRGATIQIYLKEGLPDGLLIVEKSNWVGQVLVCPRSVFTEHKKRPELKRAGIYVLAGPPEEKDLPTVYIGEADPLVKRLEAHFRNIDFWTRCIAFSSKDANLNKAHIKYLEFRLIELASQAKRADINNINNPTRPSLSEAEKDQMEVFLDEMRVIFPIIGVDIFERPEMQERSQAELYLQARGIEARGFETTKGFIVKAGSQAAKTERPSIHKYLSTRRKTLVDKGLLIAKDNVYVLAEDYAFESPSTAAGVMLGGSANGRVLWKDKKGRTLKDLQIKSV